MSTSEQPEEEIELLLPGTESSESSTGSTTTTTTPTSSAHGALFTRFFHSHSKHKFYVPYIIYSSLSFLSSSILAIFDFFVHFLFGLLALISLSWLFFGLFWRPFDAETKSHKRWRTCTILGAKLALLAPIIIYALMVSSGTELHGLFEAFTPPSPAHYVCACVSAFLSFIALSYLLQLAKIKKEPDPIESPSVVSKSFLNQIVDLFAQIFFFQSQPIPSPNPKMQRNDEFV